MQENKKRLIETIHNKPMKLVYVTAGAGVQALSDLLSVEGASRTILEALIPYSEASFIDFLGQVPEQFVHTKTAKLLAGRAFTRAKWLATENEPVLGIACSATIATDRPKRGEHRAHIAVWYLEKLIEVYVQLDKGARTRIEEETAVSNIMLNLLAKAFDIPIQIDTTLTEQDIYSETETSFAHAATELYNQQIPYIGVHAHGKLVTRNISPQLLLPGSFNPLHKGHLALATVASEIQQKPIAFEISAFNVDKSPLMPDMMLQRLAQFAGKWPVYITNAPTFLDKAKLFPGCTFVVGVDTAVRIIAPRYYNNSEAKMEEALIYIQENGNHFLVAGRANPDGNFLELGDITIPKKYQSLFTAIPAKKFRKDISSTLLRKNNLKGSR